MQKGGQPRGSLPLLGTEVRACMSEVLGTTVGLGLPRVGQMWPPHTPGSVGPPEIICTITSHSCTQRTASNLQEARQGQGASTHLRGCPGRGQRGQGLIPLQPTEKCLPSPVLVIDGVSGMRRQTGSLPLIWKQSHNKV